MCSKMRKWTIWITQLTVNSMITLVKHDLDEHLEYQQIRHIRLQIMVTISNFTEFGHFWEHAFEYFWNQFHNHL
jgi:hypothetical protein